MRSYLVPSLLFCLSSLPVCVQSHGQALQSVRARAKAISAEPGADLQRLRLTHVSLYKNGVGFFDHEGQVTGNAEVQLNLTSAQLNDVLASLTAVDMGGGHVSGITYHSATPLAQQLEALPFTLSGTPTQQELFESLRGAEVEVTGAGGPFRGRLLSIEIRPGTPTNEQANSSQPAIPMKSQAERRVLTVVAESGAMRSVELDGRTVVRVLDAHLRAELNTYLELLDRSRGQATRRLALRDQGTGARSLHVSFLSEVPVWKSTYRVLLSTGGDGRATVQGFSVVDNTTGEDWNNVQLSLIAGSPQSFLQPISQPIYSRRPEVPIAQNVQTTPQTHEAGEGPAPPPGTASADLSSGSGGSPTALYGSATGTGTGAPAINTVEVSGPVVAAARPRGMAGMAQSTTLIRATTSAYDDFFAYHLSDPVSIPKNGSALVPILQARLPVESVTLWSPSNQQPLRALWLTNDSDLALDRGAFSVVENGAFAGQGLVDPVHAGERRLLSYAADQAVHVTPERQGDTSHITRFSVALGVLRATSEEVAQASYRISNADKDARTVVVEEPRRPGWTLDEGTRPAEDTANLYRFKLKVAGHGTETLSVTQRRWTGQEFALANSTEEALRVYFVNHGADPQSLAPLQPIFNRRRHLAELDGQLAAVKSRLSALTEDQKRLRDNLTALKGGAEQRALAKRYIAELNAQEDVLSGLKADLARLEGERTEADRALREQIDNLRIG